MAIDLGSSNTTRYHSVPDHADFTLPNGDWAWIALVYPQSAADTKYIISTGSFGAANSFNLFLNNTASPDGWGCRVDALTAVTIAGVPALDTWYWVYGTRRSGSYYVGAAALGGTGSESAGVAISASYNSATGPNLGRRADAEPTRYWKGRWGQAAFISGSSITSTQATELAKGASLLSMPFASNNKALWHGQSSSGATLVDIINGRVATKQGATYGTSEEDVQTPYIWTPSIVGAAASVSSPIPVFINHYRNQGIM